MRSKRLERAAETAELLGRTDREPSQLGELRPCVGTGVVAGGEARDAVLDEKLLGRERKIHDSLSFP